MPENRLDEITPVPIFVSKDNAGDVHCGLCGLKITEEIAIPIPQKREPDDDPLLSVLIVKIPSSLIHEGCINTIQSRYDTLIIDMTPKAALARICKEWEVLKEEPVFDTSKLKVGQPIHFVAEGKRGRVVIGVWKRTVHIISFDKETLCIRDHDGTVKFLTREDAQGKLFATDAEANTAGKALAKKKCVLFMGRVEKKRKKH